MRLYRQGMDFTSYRDTQGGIHELVPSERPLAGELLSDHQCLEMGVIVRSDDDPTTRQSRLDTTLNFRCLHGNSACDWLTNGRRV